MIKYKTEYKNLTDGEGVALNVAASEILPSDDRPIRLHYIQKTFYITSVYSLYYLLQSYR